MNKQIFDLILSCAILYPIKSKHPFKIYRTARAGFTFESVGCISIDDEIWFSIYRLDGQNDYWFEVEGKPLEEFMKFIPDEYRRGDYLLTYDNDILFFASLYPNKIIVGERKFLNVLVPILTKTPNKEIHLQP